MKLRAYVSVLAFLLSQTMFSGMAASDDLPPIKEGGRLWSPVFVVDVKELKILKELVSEFDRRGHDLDDYESLYFEKGQKAYRVTFLSRFHEVGSYGVKPGLPPDIEAFVGLDGSPIEFGISR
jgi:hypothetical protein